MKVQGSPKYHFIITSNQVLKQIKLNEKLNEHTISQSGKKPIIEKTFTRNMQKTGKCFTLFHLHKFTQSLLKKIKILEEYIICEEKNNKKCKNL